MERVSLNGLERVPEQFSSLCRTSRMKQRAGGIRGRGRGAWAPERKGRTTQDFLNWTSPFSCLGRAPCCRRSLKERGSLRVPTREGGRAAGCLTACSPAPTARPPGAPPRGPHSRPPQPAEFRAARVSARRAALGGQHPTTSDTSTGVASTVLATVTANGCCHCARTSSVTACESRDHSEVGTVYCHLYFYR